MDLEEGECEITEQLTESVSGKISAGNVWEMMPIKPVIYSKALG